jgi:ABC-type nitrate/sulfonate/bicarbonate transport system substrate-binding protein
MKRRSFIKHSLLATASYAFAGFPQLSFATPSNKQKSKTRIGIFAPSHCAAPLIFAEHKGYFSDSGVKVELINYPTMSALARDLTTGGIDFGQLTVPLAFAIDAGANPLGFHHPLVLPMILGVHGSNLMIRKDSGISQPADFKDKTIATHTKLTVHYLLVRLYLQRNGIDTEKDVTMSIVNLNDLTEQLNQGKIDAFMMPEPINALAEETGQAHTYILNKFIWRYHPCCGLVSRKEFFINQDRNKMIDLVSAITRASLHINKERNRDELVSTLKQTAYGFADMPREVIEMAFAFSRSSFYPFPYQSTAVLLLSMMSDYELLPSINAKSTAREVFLSDFMRECLAGIGKKAPRNNFRPEIVLGRRFELET